MKTDDRPITPIERMVDEACGYQPGMAKQKLMDEDTEDTALVCAVLDAVVSWWVRHRPAKWTEAQHLAHYTINCDFADCDLARLVARIVQRDNRTKE